MFYRHGTRILSNPALILPIVLPFLLLLGYLDWATGPNVAMTCFYLIPICLLAWFRGKRPGYIVAALHALVWFAIDIEVLTFHSPIPYWNLVVRFLTFAVIVWLVHFCKNLTREVEALVREKTAVLQREVDARIASEQAIHKLANELSIAEDAERRRLGQELHDSFGQSLTLLKLRLESFAASRPPALPQSPASADLDGSLAILASIIQQARTLTFELYPSTLDQLGLTVTLQHYAQQLSEQLHVRIQVADSGPAITLPNPIASFLFRAIKELITNALKHGSAREVILQVRRRHDNVRIVVNDDGSGFDPDSARAGLGLRWIRERLRSLGGTLEIESAPARGTRAILDLPIIAHIPRVGSLPHGQPALG